jgi:hypothetical protein
VDDRHLPPAGADDNSGHLRPLVARVSLEALALAAGFISPSGAARLPFNPTASVVTWNNTSVPTSVGFGAAGNATDNDVTRALTLLTTSVDNSNHAQPAGASCETAGA